MPIQVDPAATTTDVASSLNPATSIDAITFTATISVVAPGGGVPGGVVDFFDGTTLLGTEEVGLSGGSFVATLTARLGGGDHAMSAHYVGTTNHLGSTSPTISQTVFGPPANPGPPPDPGPPTDPGPPDNLPGGGAPNGRPQSRGSR